MAQLLDLNNKNILITGAASGIGQATAVLCSQLGAHVILVDCSEVNSKEIQECECHVMDLTEMDKIETLVENVVKGSGRLDGLVHCAGISSRKPLNVLKREGFSKIMDVNFYSFVELVRQFSKKGRMNDASSIVVMSSVSSIKGYKAKTEYCVSKAAVDAFVRCAALELANRKIRVNSIMPAEVLTPLAAKSHALNAALGVQEVCAPLGPTEPYEVANLIAFLLSDATKTITGTSVLIDGGATL